MGRIDAGRLVLGVVVALAGCSPKLPEIAEPSRALGTVLAEETIRAAGPRKQVAIISPDKNWGLVSPVEEEFKAVLKKQGFTILTSKAVDPGDPMRSGPVGLKAADFLEVLAQFPDAGAVVSFAGAPLLKPGQGPTPEHPPVLVVATAMMGTTPGIPGDRLQLARLLEAKVIQLAVVDVSEPPPPSAGKSDALHKLFAEHYRILRQPE
jgi:hypothetical protein